MSLQTFDERISLNTFRLIVPADGIADISIVPINSSDRRIDNILASNRDGIAHLVNLAIVKAANRVNIGSVSVAAGAGYAGAPSVDILAACLPALLVGITLGPADTIVIALAVAVVATFDLSIATFGGQF